VNDPVRLAASVNAMLQDPEKSKRIGVALAARAAENFSAERMIDATERLYLDILNSRDQN